MASAIVAFVGLSQNWLLITIDGTSVPGSGQTGWQGGDGITVAFAAIVAAIGGAAFFAGRDDQWLRASVFAAGSVALVIAIVNIADVKSKADDINSRYGIDPSIVGAHVGLGLWLVAIAGLAAMMGGAIRSHRH